VQVYSCRRSNIVYDADGLGSFLKGYLKGAKPFNNGGKVVGEVNFKNLKSQCGYKLAEYINQGKIYIACEVDKSQMIKELECLQSYKLDDDGKIQLLPKAKIKELIGQSPDVLDALMMRMYFELNTPIKRAKTYFSLNIFLSRSILLLVITVSKVIPLIVSHLVTSP